MTQCWRGPDDLLAGCDGEQAAAITTAANPLCILASAGSGKTRVLTRRIAWRVLGGAAVATNVLALTFTRKAAGEMRRRLSSLGLPEPVTAGTFHAIALAELRRLAAERGQAPPVVLASKARLLNAVLADRMVVTREDVLELSGEIEWAKARVVGTGEYEAAAGAAGRKPRWPLGLVAEIYGAYEKERRRRRVLDFEDLLTTCAAELATDPGFAASASWRFRHLFVDEYQDVNLAQLRLLLAWTGEEQDLCVVGDPDQAIYAWNGSDPRALERFAAHFPGATVLKLETNYRSTSEVLTVAASVFGRRRPARAAGPRPEGPVPTVSSFPTDSEEADGVAARACLAHGPGRSWSQIAVLARTNSQLTAFAHAFAKRCVPVSILGRDGLLDRPQVREVLPRLTAARDPAALRTLAHDLRQRSGAPPVGESEEEAVTSPEGAGGGRELLELADLVEEYVETDEVATGAGLRGFLKAAARSGEAVGGGDAVALTTFHRAKGLEWSVVFVTGLEAGLVPIAHADGADALAEERRLLYVACTRAQEELHCSFARRRALSGGKLSNRRPSQWVEPIQQACEKLAARHERSPETARRALAEMRRSLRA